METAGLYKVDAEREFRRLGGKAELLRSSNRLSGTSKEVTTKKTNRD